MLVMLLLALMSCEKDQLGPAAGVQDETVVSRDVTLPFVGWYTTYPALIGADENGTLTFEIPGEGISNVLRQSTWYSVSEIFNTLTGPPYVQTGNSIFTAADGSQLIGTFEGTTGPQGIYPFVGTGAYVVTSGTGAYDGATGSGTYSYKVAPDFSYAKLEFKGTLTLK